jgi:3-dehydroquinate dehydratase/shikimate dehydrogenase
VTRGVVHSILEATPEAVQRRLAAAPRASALVEIRADHLRAGDTAGLVRSADRPVVVAVRSKDDGGAFDGSTEEKLTILRAALDAGSAFVDVEWNGPLRSLADGKLGARTILSHHGAPCDASSLAVLFDAMAGTRAARLKLVPHATRATELGAVRDLLQRARRADRPLASFATGPAGAWSRLVALFWGSWGTYGAAARGRETGDGQFTSADLLDVYRVLAISASTRWFGLCGTPLGESPSPALHAAGYKELGLDAVYVPVESGDLADVAALVDGDGLLPLSGFGVTIPLKELAAQRCARLDASAACGSANTVVVGKGGWEGWNTDAPAALALIRKHLDPRGATVAIVGAGGTARAVAAALKDAGALVTLFSRSATRGETTARAVGVDWLPLAALPGSRWDLLVQATPAGRHGEEVLLRRHLDGRMVLDAAYGAEPTPLVRSARARGLVVADGFDLLEAQAALQFERLTGRPAPGAAIGAALLSWRNASSA